MDALPNRSAPTQNRTDPRCRVEMLGALRLLRSDQPEPITRFARHKAAALLAFLALNPRPQPRERLLDLFWPELDLPAARDNLSTTLGSLRRQIEPPGVARGSVLTANHTLVGLNPAALSTDVADFERLLDAAQAASQTTDCIALRRQALALYQGDLLPEFYDDWAAREMMRLQGRYTQALEALAEDCEAVGDLASALQAAQRLVASDAYAEEGYVRVMRLLVKSGHIQEARATYQQLTRLFAEEYGAPLSAATQRTLEALLAPPLPETPGAEPAAGVGGGLARTMPTSPAVGRGQPLPISAPARPVSAPPLPPAMAASAPGASGSSAPPLPLLLSRFFGREIELEQMARLLLQHKGIPDGPTPPPRPSRLLTLLGLGGTGKTRLALEFVHQASERFGVWGAFVSLADLTSAAQIPEEMARVLKLPAAPGAEVSTLERVAAYLQGLGAMTTPSVLLVLDNLEHLLPPEGGALDAAAPTGLAGIVADLLERVRGLAVVCTSRQRLGLRGERQLPVGPLPVPDPEGRGTDVRDLDALLQVPSVALYLDRAQAARPDFTLTPTNAPAVAGLCRLLEGSPLALELAAAWVRLLPPRKMGERLGSGLDIPEGSYTDLPARHRSLSAALEWSYRLLSPSAQRLLGQLSVFVGGWTLGSATAVADDGDETRTLTLLSALQEASLLTVLEAGAASENDVSEVRYGFLETVRTYARQRLEEQEAPAVVLRRHADHFRGLAEVAELALRGPQQAQWLSRLEAEHDNLRAALSFYLEGGSAEDAEYALRLGGSLVRFWSVRGHWTEGRRQLDEVLARTADQSGPSAIRAKVLNGAGSLAREQGDNIRARELFEASLAIRRELGDKARVADTLHNLGMLALLQEDYAVARTRYEESLAISRELGDVMGIADELHHLGWLAHEQRDLTTARLLYEESLAMRRPLGDLRGIAFTLQNLANIALSQNDPARSRAIHEESLAIRRALGDRKGIAITNMNLGKVAFATGDYAAARALFAEGLAGHEELGEMPMLVNALYCIGDVELAEQQAPRAAQIYGAAAALAVTLGIGHHYASDAERSRSSVSAVMDAATFERCWAVGQRMPRVEAVAFALASGRIVDAKP